MIAKEFQQCAYVVDSHPAEGRLWLQRFHVVTTGEGEDGDYPFVLPLGRHFATYAHALAHLSENIGDYPHATIAGFVLSFDPDDPDQLAAYKRFRGEVADDWAVMQ